MTSKARLNDDQVSFFAAETGITSATRRIPPPQKRVQNGNVPDP